MIDFKKSVANFAVLKISIWRMLVAILKQLHKQAYEKLPNYIIDFIYGNKILLGRVLESFRFTTSIKAERHCTLESRLE